MTSHVRVRFWGSPLAALAIAATAFALPAAPAIAAHPCPPDTNCSGAVDVDDLIAVILEWGQTNTPADIDASGIVDVDDLIAVILNWGACTFPFQTYPNVEAHQIGLEMLGASGPLTLSQELYDRSDRDLALIRVARPSLADQFATPAWASSMIIGVPTGASTDEIDCLNTYYNATMSLLFSSGGTDYHVVAVGGMINIPALCTIYAQADNVQFADPDGIIGGENFWTPSNIGKGTWAWNIDDGFTDCFDGCDCHYIFEFHVTAAGAVTLVFFDQWGQKWCVFE